MNVILIIGFFLISIVVGYFIGDYICFQKELKYTSENTCLQMEISKLKNSLEHEKRENEYLKEENKQLFKKVNELQEDLLREIK